jgi:type I restriction enzyme S subunit
VNTFFQSAPDEWVRTPLKFLVHGPQNGAWGNDVGEGEVDALCIRVADFDWPHLSLKMDNPTSRSFTDAQVKNLKLEAGDIILEKSGGGEKTPVGRVVKYDLAEPAVTSNFVARVRPRKNTDPNFLLYLLAAQYMSKFTNQFVKQNTGIQNLDDTGLFRSDVWLPDLPTQKRIAAFLDRETARIDALIAKKERLVNAQNARLTAKLQKMVLGGASVQRGLGGDWLQNLPDEWTLTPLKHLVTVMGGATPSKDREDFWVGDIPWVSPKDMKVDVIYDVPDHVSEDAAKGSALNKIPAEAVLIVVRGMILARFVPVCRLGAEATINQDMKALLPQNKVIRGDYLQRMLQGFGDVLMSFIEEAAHGTKKLRSEALFGIKFPLPPLDQQEAISAEYENARVLTERIVESTQSSITRLREYRAALITAAVTGQIDVDSHTRSGAASAKLDQIEEEMQG